MFGVVVAALAGAGAAFFGKKAALMVQKPKDVKVEEGEGARVGVLVD